MKNFFKLTCASMLGFLIAGFVGIFILMTSLVGMLSLGEDTPEVEYGSMLMLKLNGPIVERGEENPFSGLEFRGFEFPSETGLDHILESIEKAKRDDRIKGIYLCPSVIMAGYGTVEEIRNAILDFKESGKVVYAYADALTQKSYYLVSAADSVMLNPKGMLEFQGLSSSVTFYKEALAKIGVKMDIIRHGKFKSAVEPFLNNEMSTESRLQMQKLLDSTWEQIITAISESRGISVDELNRLADETTVFSPADYLLENNLIDGLLYKDVVLSQLKQLCGISMSEDVPVITPNDYAKVIVEDEREYTRDRVAVIYAEGGIDMSTEGILSEKLSKTIREARLDKQVKAIVLRVNSPGGSAYGSEVIWREVELANEIKPVVVSMGNYAASGGYYISCAAREIFAESTTLTGSIGIYAQLPNASELMTEKLGLNQEFVYTNENSVLLPTGSLIPALSRPMTDFERKKLQGYIEYGYDTFITRVSAGRSMTKEDVDKIGQGRVWSATDALEIGLVDSIGTIKDAIARAAELAELDNYRVRKLPELKDPFENLMKSFGTQAKNYFIKDELGADYKKYEYLKEAIKQGGIMARMPFELEIQ